MAAINHKLYSKLEETTILDQKDIASIPHKYVTAILTGRKEGSDIGFVVDNLEKKSTVKAARLDLMGKITSGSFKGANQYAGTIFLFDRQITVDTLFRIWQDAPIGWSFPKVKEIPVSSIPRLIKTKYTGIWQARKENKTTVKLKKIGNLTPTKLKEAIVTPLVFKFPNRIVMGNFIEVLGEKFGILREDGELSSDASKSTVTVIFNKPPASGLVDRIVAAAAHMHGKPFKEAATTNMDKLRDIVTNHSAQPLRFKDGKSVKVDAVTANLMVKVFDLMEKPESKEKFERMVTSSKADFGKVLDFCWKAAS